MWLRARLEWTSASNSRGTAKLTHMSEAFLWFWKPLVGFSYMPRECLKRRENGILHRSLVTRRCAEWLSSGYL